MNRKKWIKYMRRYIGDRNVIMCKLKRKWKRKYVNKKETKLHFYHASIHFNFMSCLEPKKNVFFRTKKNVLFRTYKMEK